MKATFMAIEAGGYSSVHELKDEKWTSLEAPTLPAAEDCPDKQESSSPCLALASRSPWTKTVALDSDATAIDSCEHPYLHAHVMQSRADFRYDRLLEKLNSEKFIIRGHVRSYLHKLEVAAGYANSQLGPERRTINQLMDRLVSTTDATKMTVSMVTKTGVDTRQMDVLIHSDIEVDQQFLKEIRSAHWDFETVSRQQSHVRSSANVLLQHGNSIPVMDEIERLLPVPASYGFKDNPGRRGNQEVSEGNIKKHDNGFISAKMTRVKLLHYLICRMVGLGGFDASSILLEDEGIDEEPWVNRSSATKPVLVGSEQMTNALSTHEEKDTAMVHTRPTVLMSDTSNEFKFSPRNLWDFMPLELFMQIVGCSLEIADLPQLCRKYRALSEMPEEKQKEVIDENARLRLSELLDILCRMGLIDSIVAASVSPIGLHNCSKFIAGSRGKS